ncbi:uncharacterized protein BX664DRAFT_334090 [Halteromyces radiatus]|uniref:uncharacterized protein n=1 Tax=Halteromyces radiatus TaxID=101107 RepID=UPI00221F1EF2|nr:uncharacterized protein BX664DRAFT_334090 [Halteromyces radiatus]KAI8089858.1 hypothetical protein BX664DRAFT_334090 [Halteromyces radiatus]
MAAASYNRPLIGHIGKILNAIPVVRPQDVVNKGTGTVKYDPDTQPFLIIGQNTKFTQELHPRDFIIFGRNYKCHVANVISDTECEVTHAIAIGDDDQEIHTIKQLGIPFKIAPHVDQTPVYTEVNHYLNNNECITIFPEGGSHDRPEMLPLKAGFAVMALGAMAEYPEMDIKIVPVGLNYFHPDRFRSRVVVSFGQPLSIDREDVELFKKGDKYKRQAVTKLMDQSDVAFKLVTTSAPDYDTLMVIQAARRLYAPAKQTKPTIQQVVKMNQHFGVGWAKLKDDPRQKELSRKVKIYNDTLAFFGIRDHQVEKLDITPFRASTLLIRRLIKLAMLAGLGAPAFISNIPLTLLIRYISKKKQSEALAGSMVKIKAKDVLATWKIIVAAFAAPALYGFYSLIYFIYLFKRRPALSLRNKMIRTCALWIIQPILHYFLMRLGDTGLDIYKSIKPLFLAIRNPAVGKLLREMRANLSRDITEFVNQHADIILPNEERHHQIGYSLPETLEVDVEDEEQQEQQQEQEMESIVLLTEDVVDQQQGTFTVANDQPTVEAY